jgi:hypothetical protein
MIYMLRIKSEILLIFFYLISLSIDTYQSLKTQAVAQIQIVTYSEFIRHYFAFQVKPCNLQGVLTGSHNAPSLQQEVANH